MKKEILAEAHISFEPINIDSKSRDLPPGLSDLYSN